MQNRTNIFLFFLLSATHCLFFAMEKESSKKEWSENGNAIIKYSDDIQNTLVELEVKFAGSYTDFFQKQYLKEFKELKNHEASKSKVKKSKASDDILFTVNLKKLEFKKEYDEAVKSLETVKVKDIPALITLNNHFKVLKTKDIEDQQTMVQNIETYLATRSKEWEDLSEQLK